MSEPRREKFRKGLSTLYLPYYDALCSELSEDWQPIQGLRTTPEQDALYAQGRSKQGPPCRCKEKPCSVHLFGVPVTWAQGGKSPHNYGCASDWVKFSDGVPLWGLEDWSEYQAAVAKVGLRWGADWNGNGRTGDEKLVDRPHNELKISCSWNHVYQVYAHQGMRAAQEHIESNLIK